MIGIEMPYLVFCCYAREDKNFLQALKTHLKPLEREELITMKADIDISPGTEWETTLTHYLDTADIILLLISSDFIASDYCFNQEMTRAIERHEQGTARVVPVIIRPATWHKMPFGKLHALPKDSIPISIAQNTDTAFMSVTKGIRTIVQELTTAISLHQMSEDSLLLPAQNNSLPINNQERNTMDTKDDPSTYTIKNSGTVHTQIIGGQHGKVISGENIYINENQKDGIRALERGAKALLNGDYSSAKKELRVAVEEIDQEQLKKEAAKARYLQTLALLGHEQPRDQGIGATEKINQLLNAAVRLDQCNAYIMTRAAIIDPSLRKQANRTRITDYDEELFTYLKRCQPDLYHQIRQIFSI